MTEARRKVESDSAQEQIGALKALRSGGFFHMSLPGGAVSVKPGGNGKEGGPSDGGQLWYWYAIARFTLPMRNRCFIQAGKYSDTPSLSSPIGMSVASIMSCMFSLL